MSRYRQREGCLAFFKARCASLRATLHPTVPSVSADMTHETPDDLQKAVNAYTGPITKCPPGKARARNVKPKATDRADQWLKAHRADQPKDRHHEERVRLLRIEQQRQRERRNDKRDAPAIRRPTGSGTSLVCDGNTRSADASAWQWADPHSDTRLKNGVPRFHSLALARHQRLS